MKKSHLIAEIFLFGLFPGLFGCQKDDSETITDVRDPFVGSWNVTDRQLTKANYQVRIYKDENNSEKVWLINFHGTSDTAFGYIDLKKITLSPQTLSYSHLNASGSGLMEGGKTKINFEYYINDIAQQDTIIATYQK